uniref:Uncharacterized protein n=1 Tax=Glossina palpalis gambiensis TaxID=67801 RepID=A0A1B0BM78_9MUSC
MKVFDDCTLRLVRSWFWIIITWLISLCGFTDIISPVSSQKLLWKRMKDKLGKEARARATVKAGGEESWLESVDPLQEPLRYLLRECLPHHDSQHQEHPQRQHSGY